VVTYNSKEAVKVLGSAIQLRNHFGYDKDVSPYAGG